MNELPESWKPSPGLLRDKVVLVTGATGGLGEALALACARAGAQLVLAGRNVKKLELLDDAVQAAGAPAAALYPLDLAGATWADYERLAQTLEGELGRLDGLAHCAAHFRHFQPLADAEAKDWVDTLQVNLTAPYALTRHCLPLLERSEGSVLFVSDEAGRKPRAYSGPYGVAKVALEGMAQAWAQELQSAGRVRVNTLDPAPMDTALRRKGFAGGAKAEGPERAANAALWLLSAQSRPASGQAFSLRRSA
ncbi:MAG TPA: SDR family NAD(P)-dependent oxidoreductase [Verrucomicrobiae bacterium]|nr:SDR family NAD(P)-dependent oxidoreductase [Verrucomicrobiae bacterium]